MLRCFGQRLHNTGCPLAAMPRSTDRSTECRLFARARVHTSTQQPETTGCGQGCRARLSRAGRRLAAAGNRVLSALRCCKPNKANPSKVNKAQPSIPTTQRLQTLISHANNDAFMRTEGIFRLSATKIQLEQAMEDLAAYAQQLDTSESYDPILLANVIKQLVAKLTTEEEKQALLRASGYDLARLPTSILTQQQMQQFEQQVNLLDEQSLPEPLVCLLPLLARVSIAQQQLPNHRRLDAYNLACCLAPGLIPNLGTMAELANPVRAMNAVAIPIGMLTQLINQQVAALNATNAQAQHPAAQPTPPSPAAGQVLRFTATSQQQAQQLANREMTRCRPGQTVQVSFGNQYLKQTKL